MFGVGKIGGGELAGVLHTVDESVEDELSVFIDQIIDVAKDSAIEIMINDFERNAGRIERRTYHIVL